MGFQPSTVNPTVTPRPSISKEPTVAPTVTPRPSISAEPTIATSTFQPSTVNPTVTPRPSISEEPTIATSTFQPSTSNPTVTPRPSISSPPTPIQDPVSCNPTRFWPGMDIASGQENPNDGQEMYGDVANASAAATRDSSITSSNSCGQMDAPESILDYICWMENFNTLCNAIQRAGLDTLLGGMSTAPDEGVITLFAPTNSGMEDAGLTEASIETMDRTKLITILKNHMMVGEVMAEDLICDEKYDTLSPAGNPSNPSTTSSVDIKCIQIMGTNTKTVSGPYNNYTNRPTILAPNDMVLCNGIVQPIDNAIRRNYNSPPN